MLGYVMMHSISQANQQSWDILTQLINQPSEKLE